MTAAADLAKAIANTVRTVRAAHGLSQQGLAARAGISDEVMAELEQGQTMPALGTLIHVADALLIPLARLVEGQPEPVIRVLAPEQQPVLWHGPHGGTGTLLVGSDPKPALELWSWRLEPGEIRVGAPHLPGNREITYVNEGTLTLTLDGCRYVMGQGTSAVFVGDRPHSYANEADTPLHYTVALADP